MRQRLHDKEKLYVKSFSGATVSCMTDYVKPTMKFNPDAVLIHCGTNDLRSEKKG